MRGSRTPARRRARRAGDHEQSGDPSPTNSGTPAAIQASWSTTCVVYQNGREVDRASGVAMHSCVTRRRRAVSREPPAAAVASGREREAGTPLARDQARRASTRGLSDSGGQRGGEGTPRQPAQTASRAVVPKSVFRSAKPAYATPPRRAVVRAVRARAW
jgi:hypothetical protein